MARSGLVQSNLAMEKTALRGSKCVLVQFQNLDPPGPAFR